MAAIYALLIECETSLISQKHDELLDALNSILDNGYTYEAIRNEIIKAFNEHSMFPFYKFKNRIEGGNLLKSGTRYYHKQLNIMSKLNPVQHDIDSGTITSQGNEFWIEPRASYTQKEFADYMYSKGMMDLNEFPPRRLYKLAGTFVNQYGLEYALFMIEHCARVYDETKEQFSLKRFDSYYSIAAEYLKEIKNNCVYSGGLDYVPRKRMLSD